MGYKAKTKIDMGNYNQSTKEQEAYEWCINNNIYIAPSAVSTTEWKICITINGNHNLSPDSYKKIDIWKQLYRFYLYYYNKYNTNLKIEPMIVKKGKAAATEQKQITNQKELF